MLEVAERGASHAYCNDACTVNGALGCDVVALCAMFAGLTVRGARRSARSACRASRLSGAHSRSFASPATRATTGATTGSSRSGRTSSAVPSAVFLCVAVQAHCHAVTLHCTVGCSTEGPRACPEAQRLTDCAGSVQGVLAALPERAIPGRGERADVPDVPVRHQAPHERRVRARRARRQRLGDRGRPAAGDARGRPGLRCALDTAAHPQNSFRSRARLEQFVRAW